MIDYIKEFLVLCKHNNFKRAAQELYVNPSTLSRHILYLEKELGCILLIRNNSYCELTPAGKLLYKKGNELVAMYDELICQMVTGKNSEQNTLKVCSSPFNHPLLFEMYHTFQERYPEIRFQMHPESLTKDDSEILTFQPDIIVSSEEYCSYDLKDYTKLLLFRDKVCIVISRSHPILRSTKHFEMADLAKYPFYKLAKGDLIQTTYHRLVAEIPNFQKQYENGTRLPAADLWFVVRTGNGWGVFCESLAKEFAHDCAILPLSEGEGSEVNIIMAYKNNSANPAVKLFLHTARDILHKHTNVKKIADK